MLSWLKNLIVTYRIILLLIYLDENINEMRTFGDWIRGTCQSSVRVIVVDGNMSTPFGFSQNISVVSCQVAS